MPKGLPVFLILLVCMFEAVAQGSTTDEYVITHSGDTLFGQVQQGISPQSISFKASEGTGSRKFTVEEIKGYKTGNGRFYVAQAFALSEEDVKTVFLQALVLGRVSLFKYQDVFLVTKNDSTQIQIQEAKKEKIVNGRRVIQTYYTNVGVLSYMLSDCPSLTPVNEIKRFSERSLTKLVVAYNECTSGSFTEFDKDKAWTKVRLGLAAGVHVSHLDFSANTTSFPFLTEANFTSSLAPAFMTSFTFSSPRVNERLFIQADLLFTTNKHTAFYLKEHAQLPERFEVDVKMRSFTIPLSLGYVVTEGKIRTKLHLGASLHWNLSPTVAYWKESEIGNIIYTYEEGPFPMEEIHYGFLGGLEVHSRIWSKTDGFLALRGGLTENVFSADFFSKKHLEASLTTFSLLAGIKF